MTLPGTAPPDRTRPTRSTTPIRQEVREVLALADRPAPRMCDAWMRGHDPQFSRLLASHGLIGLTWPARLGGRGATNMDRLVVTEELLRVGAPVAAHWIADRQIGPTILRYGSPALQRELLPQIARGEVTFCLGMSETESGSDLAAVRTRAEWDGTHYRVTGRKVWTSHAHRATHAYVLARTGGGDAKQQGLTEFVVDLSSPGVDIRPIYDLSGEHHFNEVTFDEVPVAPDYVIGEKGQGWRQVTEQLAFERGGMERVLSTYPLLAALVEKDTAGASGHGPATDVASLGELVARLHTLRAMALQVAGSMDDGQAPVQQAAMLKYLGTEFEGDVVEYARHAVAVPPDPDAGGVEELHASGILASPGFTLRGGASEVLLTIVGRRELAGGRPRRHAPGDELRRAVDEVLDERGSTGAALAADRTWELAAQLGWTGIGVPEAADGSGGEVADLAVVASALARHGCSAPVVETAVAGQVLAGAGRTVDPSRPRALALGEGVRVAWRDGELVLDGVQRVPWARSADAAIVSADGPDGEVLVDLPLGSSGVSVRQGRNLAGEPRDTVTLHDVRLPATALVGDRGTAVATRTVSAMVHTAAMVGALEAATEMARGHALTREQFGKPLADFQAVAHTIARMAAELACARVALAESLAEVTTGGQGWRTVVARIVASRAATRVCRGAHQVLGAMGVTREHSLHLATLRLWAWRDELVSERALAYRLGEAVLTAGEARTWDWCVHEAAAITDDGDSPWRLQQWQGSSG